MHFQNKHTFIYQKILLHRLSFLVSKIVESLQCILKTCGKHSWRGVTFSKVAGLLDSVK